MKVQNNIDLIKNLELLKPRLSDNIEINKKKFADTSIRPLRTQFCYPNGQNIKWFRRHPQLG